MDIPDIHTEPWWLHLNRTSAIPSPTADTDSAMACPPMESVTALAGGMDTDTVVIAITATTTAITTAITMDDTMDVTTVDMDTDIGTVTAAGSSPQLPGG